MVTKIPKIDDIPEKERTPLVLMLLEVLNALKEENQALRDEIARLKGQKPKPNIKPSKLESRRKKQAGTKKKRPGSAKRKKSQSLEIHDTVKIPPKNLPSGCWFKEYNDFLVQGLRITPFNTLYRLERWESPTGGTFVGKLPPELKACLRQLWVHFFPFFVQKARKIRLVVKSGFKTCRHTTLR